MADKPVTQDDLKKKLEGVYKYIEDELRLVYKSAGEMGARFDTLRHRIEALEKRVDALERK